jgi:hypothetical protein
MQKAAQDSTADKKLQNLGSGLESKLTCLSRLMKWQMLDAGNGKWVNARAGRRAVF